MEIPLLDRRASLARKVRRGEEGANQKDCAGIIDVLKGEGRRETGIRIRSCTNMPCVCVCHEECVWHQMESFFRQ